MFCSGMCAYHCQYEIAQCIAACQGWFAIPAAPMTTDALHYSNVVQIVVNITARASSESCNDVFFLYIVVLMLLFIYTVTQLKHIPDCYYSDSRPGHPVLSLSGWIIIAPASVHHEWRIYARIFIPYHFHSLNCVLSIPCVPYVLYCVYVQCHEPIMRSCLLKSFLKFCCCFDACA